MLIHILIYLTIALNLKFKKVAYKFKFRKNIQISTNQKYFNQLITRICKNDVWMIKKYDIYTENLSLDTCIMLIVQDSEQWFFIFSHLSVLQGFWQVWQINKKIK